METTEAVRQEILEILDGYFRYTLLLSLPKDIPAAADDLAGLFAKKVKALTEALAAMTHKPVYRHPNFEVSDFCTAPGTRGNYLCGRPAYHAVHQTPERVLGQGAS